LTPILIQHPGCAVRCGPLGSIAGGDVLTGLLPAVKAVVAGWPQDQRIGTGRPESGLACI